MLSNARAANRPSSSSSSSSSSSPFTATQWQELEHQALIYKYMVSGVPIPPELLFSVKRSLDSSLASIGWGCFQVGLGKKGDPEPGRCRRTDGKKWRCSKEAYPGSKYCDRHMHRGRNRSRKPVEISSSSSSPSPSTTPNTASRPSPPITSTTTTTSNSNYYHNPYLTTYNTSPSLINPLSISSSTSSLESEVHHQAPLNGQNILNTTFLYNSSNSSPCSKTTTTPNLLMDSLSSSSSHHHHHPASDKDYRYLQGVREDDQPLHHHQYGTSAQSELDNFYSYPSSKQDYHNQQQQQHCFVLGADFKSSSSSSMSAINNRALMKVEEGNSKSVKEMSSHKPMHHFFGVGGADSWLDLASSSRPS